MPKALFVVSEEGYWGEECANPIDTLSNEDFDIDVATPSGSKAVIDETSLDTDNPFVSEEAAALSEDIHENHEGMNDPVPVASVDAEDYDAVEGDTGKALVLCHAAGLFAFTRDSNGDFLVEGRDVTGFPNEWEADLLDEYDRLPDGRKLPYWVQTEVEAVGANWDAEVDKDESVAVDGDLVTGRGPNSSRQAALTLLDELGIEASA